MLLFLSFVLFDLVVGSPGTLDSQLKFVSTDSSWEHRSSHVGTFSFTLGPTSWTGTWWNSLSTKVSNNSIEGDYLWGSLYVGTGWFPTSWVSYFSADIDVNRNIPGDKSKFDWLNFTVDASSAFIASAFLGLQEKTPSGTVVRTLLFNQILPRPVLWNYNATKSNTRSNPDQGIYVSVFDGSLPLDPVVIELTFVFTNQGGVLDLEPRVTIVPKAIESFLTVSHWNYANPENTLSFLMVTGTAKGSFSGKGVLGVGSGKSRTFVRLADNCLADGTVKKVILNHTVSKNGLIDFNNPNVRLQLEAKYQQNVQVTFWEVRFPPNSDVVTYDPSVGTGSDPWTAPNVGLIVGLSILAFVLFVALLIGLFYYFSKRTQYDTVK
jgi:hypothetical protein